MFQTSFVDKIKIHILLSVSFFPENRTVYDMKNKNTIQPNRQQLKIEYGVENILLACQITEERI